MATNVGKEAMQIAGGGSFVIGAPHAWADIVHHVAPADNRGVPIGVPTYRVHARRLNRPPSSMLDGARQPQAPGMGAEVEHYKTSLKRYRQDPNRVAASKARRLEDLSSCGATLVNLVIDDLTKRTCNK
jgi:hypothetical protein